MKIQKVSEVDFAPFVTEQIVERIVDWQSKNAGLFRLGLTGGGSVKAVYNLLGQSLGIDWQRVILILTDERFVKPTHADSNLGMIADNLLMYIDLPEENLLFFDTDEGAKIPKSLELMSEQLMVLVQERQPLFDLLLLGVGEDGHIASLFPVRLTTDAASYTEFAEAPPTLAVKERLSLTFQALKSSQEIFLLLKGEQKNEIFSRMQESGQLPVQQLLAEKSEQITVVFGVN